MGAPAPPDPHPLAHLLLKPLAPWGVRIPAYVVLVLVALFVFWVIPHLDFLGPSRTTQDLQAFQNVLREKKGYLRQQQALAAAQSAHTIQQAHAEHAAAQDFVSADSAGKLADSAAAALKRAKTAAESLQTQGKEIVALRGANASLTSGAAHQQVALIQSSLVIMDLTERVALAEKRVDDLERTGSALARDVSCTLAHLCLKNVHIGAGVGYGVTDHNGTVYAGKQITVAVVWSP